MPKQPTKKGGRNGKKPKKFLEADEAVRLAALIGGAEEDKTSGRVNRRKSHHTSDGVNMTDSRKRVSASKIKLKEKKAAIASDISRTKREKKQKTKPKLQESSSETAPAPLKRVSFA